MTLPFDSKTITDNSDILFRLINPIIKIEPTILYCKNVICNMYCTPNVKCT